MKRILLFLIVVGFATKAKSQQNPFFSHFALNPTYYNAGYIGVEEYAHVIAMHRSQWLGYPGGNAPTTQLLTLSAPIQWKLTGAAINIFNDNLGPVSNIEIQAGVGYKKDFSFGTISLGVMPGIYSKTLNGDDLIFDDPNDPFNTGTRESQIKPDVSAGIYFKSRKNFHFGLGVTNIMSPKFNFGIEDFNNQVARSFNLSGGTIYKIRRDITLAPTAIVRSDLQTYTLDIGSMLYFKDRIWGGLTYRLEESANVLLGYSFLDSKALKAGYSFEYVIQEQEAKQPISFEIFIRYDLPNVIFGGKKQQHTPRFRF